MAETFIPPWGLIQYIVPIILIYREPYNTQKETIAYSPYYLKKNLVGLFLP